MGKLREKLKNMDRKTLYKLSAAVFATALLLVTFTFAWFTSRDVVTNSIESNEIDITLLEPEWYEKGQELAKTAEPGMWIPKDPYVLNNSNIAVYVRMKVVIKVKDDSGDYVDISNSSDSGLKSQYDQILENYLMYKYTEASGNTTASSTALLNDADVSNNPAYFYENGWFYYGKKTTTTATGGTTTTTAYTFTPLASGSSTGELFLGLLLPAKKTDYNNGVFNKDFRIDIEAQAIGADANLSADEVFGKFNSLDNNGN